MRLLRIPLPQLRALGRACPGLLEAITSTVEEGDDPCLRIRRMTPTRECPRWYVEVGSRVLVLNAEDTEGMAAAVPVFLVDLVEDVREELKPVFLDGQMDRGIGMVIPFASWFSTRGRPS